MFLNKTYNEDEDSDLLAVLAMIADINNEQVKERVKGSDFCNKLYKDAESFSQDKEIQMMTFEDELAIMDWNSAVNLAKKEGKEEERNDIGTLNLWLLDQNRIEDVRNAASDSDYMDKLFKEYRESLSRNQNNN